MLAGAVIERRRRYMYHQPRPASAALDNPKRISRVDTRRLIVVPTSSITTVTATASLMRCYLPVAESHQRVPHTVRQCNAAMYQLPGEGHDLTHAQ